jgi:glutamate dehydrogenase
MHRNGDRNDQGGKHCRGLGESAPLLRRYAEAFPASYREDFTADEAVDDVAKIEALLEAVGVPAAGEACEGTVYEPAPLGMSLYRREATPGMVSFKVFRSGSLRALSDVLPMLENMGFRVISEVPYPVEPAGAAEPVWVRDFELEAVDGAAIDVAEVRERFEATFARVWDGAIDDDAFNRLVVAAGLTWRQVVVLRAYHRYLRQIGIAFSLAYTVRALAGNPVPTRLLVEIFEARFEPGAEAESRERASIALAEFREALTRVRSLDDDRILRRFRSLIRATLRTNFFQTAPDGAPKGYLSFKLDSRAIKRLPKPKPLYEIWVYSPRTEAVHLRGGKVARGGVRWSDRPEDFRFEILGLMKAQMVKNTVIIPVGAKGGFIVKRPPAGGREAVAREAVECYKTMVRGLLDLTDNLDGDQVVPPPGVVRHDGDDPYLVVADDKGTASFSDVANAVAADYGFWLGDGFASGGSAGYDHKAMGITARGAWEAVKRHFRELGTDVQEQDFTVVGVGDMSGDVFGNGMLLSRHIRLLGAFNHLHVFVDPDPAAAASWAERKRLFELPRSTWADYAPALISPGGGVFERSAKSIPVSAEMRERFGIQRASVTPDELIRTLLRAPADLLWFGGIGTFVKAADEGDTEVADRVNDEVRVSAPELTCRVIGEGANLGVTQLGRIEYALGGGRINTDAIDNSGGVDTSDHEVNIKILLSDAVARGRLDLAGRNALLAEMTDEVGRLVLRDNYLQTQAITVTEAEGPAGLDAQALTIRELERAGRLDRRLEFLPDPETLAERRAAGRGLTRPEIAVLLAYAKISLYHDLVPSDLPDEPELVHDLVRYFPRPLRKAYREEIERHRLRREIVATHVTNSMVNRVGPTFLTRMSEAAGAPPTDVARAYAISRDSFELRWVWAEIEALDNRAEAAVQVAMIREVGRLVERTTLWFLRNARHRLDISARVAEFRPGAAAVLGALETVLPAPELAALGERRDRYTAQGVPADLARWVAAADVLASVCDIVGIARRSEFGIEEVARAYFALGSRFGLDALRRRASALGEDGRWQAAAAAALIQDLLAHQGAMTRSVLDEAPGGLSAADATDTWLDARRGLVERVDHTVAELAAAAAIDLPMLAVVNHQLRLLIDGR